MDPDGKSAATDGTEVVSERMPTALEKKTIAAITAAAATVKKEEEEIITVQVPQGRNQVVQKHQGGNSNNPTTVTVTIDNTDGGLFLFLTRAFKSPDTPEGYNSTRRFTARWVLWGVVFGLIRSRLVVALLCAASSIVILKEGTVFSGKNLKWMILSMLSFGISVLAWSFRRAHDSITATIDDDEDGNEDDGQPHHRRRYPVMKILRLVLKLSSKWLATVWAAILGLFLLSALLGSKKDQEALKAAVVKGADVVGEAADVVAEKGKVAAQKGKKAAGKAAGAASKKLEEFSKKME